LKHEFRLEFFWFSIPWSDSDTFHYNYILVVKEITLKMAGWLAETFRWP